MITVVAAAMAAAPSETAIARAAARRLAAAGLESHTATPASPSGTMPHANSR